MCVYKYQIAPLKAVVGVDRKNYKLLHAYVQCVSTSIKLLH